MALSHKLVLGASVYLEAMARRLLAPLATVSASLVLAGIALAGGGPDPHLGYGKDVKHARALGYCNAFAANEPRMRGCLIHQLLALVTASRDPASEVPRIDRYAHASGGYLEGNCHILMHTVGRRYGAQRHVTLEKLWHFLPRSNDPGCSAGFAHGLMTFLGPQIIVAGPKGVAAQCARAPTRYERYSCIHGLGHAYARLFLEYIDLGLQACGKLGPENAPDCAQGVYHDYWIAVSGLDGARRPANAATSPRAICARAPRTYIRGCWYRAWLERPPSAPVSSAARILALCRGLATVQHAGCVTGASLITSSDPFQQLRICSRLRSIAAIACVRGVRVGGVALSPLDQQVDLVRRCASIVPAAQHGCYFWLGKTLAVITNGRFGDTGCTRLAFAATQDRCRLGARSYEGPLETFS